MGLVVVMKLDPNEGVPKVILWFLLLTFLSGFLAGILYINGECNSYWQQKLRDSNIRVDSFGNLYVYEVNRSWINEINISDWEVNENELDINNG